MKARGHFGTGFAAEPVFQITIVGVRSVSIADEKHEEGNSDTGK
jgi:hypothetical protein